MTKRLEFSMKYAIGAVAIALFMLPQSALAANAPKATLQTVAQQFQQATAAVLAAATDFFGRMNEVEQSKALEELAFEHKPINIRELQGVQIISPQELKFRTDAIKVLSQYMIDLANLAGGASLKTFGQNLQGLSKNLKQLSTDAGSLPQVPAASFLKNKEFPGIVSGAVSAISALVELVESKKAQSQIRDRINKDKAALTEITDEIGLEMELAYARRKAREEEHQSDLAIEYNHSLSGNVFLSLLIAKELEASSAQVLALKNVNPARAVEAMKKAEAAMVQFVSAGQKGADLDALVGAAGTLFSTAQASQPPAACPAAK